MGVGGGGGAGGGGDKSDTYKNKHNLRIKYCVADTVIKSNLKNPFFF